MLIRLSRLTIQLIETTQRLAGGRLDAYILALAAHGDVSLINELLQFHEMLLREKLQLAPHFTIVNQRVQLLGKLLKLWGKA